MRRASQQGGREPVKNLLEIGSNGHAERQLFVKLRWRIHWHFRKEEAIDVSASCEAFGLQN